MRRYVFLHWKRGLLHSQEYRPGPCRLGRHVGHVLRVQVLVDVAGVELPGAGQGQDRRHLLLAERDDELIPGVDRSTDLLY